MRTRHACWLVAITFSSVLTAKQRIDALVAHLESLQVKR